MAKVAIMQPYLFPYLGYFQLVNTVDSFVFYDDVSFIKQGWINRNKILISGKEQFFTIPLKKASSFQRICQTQINENLFANWKIKFFKSVEQSYKKAKYFQSVYPLLELVFNKDYRNISELASFSIICVANYLNINTRFYNSSDSFRASFGLKREDRIIQIMKDLQASKYFNLIGGMEIYDRNHFIQNGIELNFIQSKEISYNQFNKNFIGNLSIIDVLMFNEPNAVIKFLNHCDLE